MRFRLGDVTFDGENRQLLRGEEPVALSPEARHLLEYLIEKSPRAVSRQERQRTLWADVHVSEWNLPALVSELRRALGDDPDQPRFIRMVHGFGYAFEADGSLPEPSTGEVAPVPLRHRLVWDGRDLPLEEGENVLGRDPQGICIEHSTVSRRHARITVSGESATLEDAGSKNGTWRLEELLEGPLGLADGDEFRLGEVALVYHGPGTRPAEELQLAE